MGGLSWDKTGHTQTLIWWWGHKTPADIAGLLGRSEDGVRQKARELKLKHNRVHLSALAAKLGVDKTTLQRLLGKAKVKCLLARDSRYDREKKATKRAKRVTYDEETATAAFIRWNSTETIRAAAGRIGKDQHWLKRRLVLTGAFSPVRGHRYSAAEIAAAERVVILRKRGL